MKKNIILFFSLWSLAACVEDPVPPNSTLAAILPGTVSSISSTSARAGGNVVSAGGAVILERGICFSTTTNPTISNTKLVATGGIGSFICEMTGLNPGTTYYVRAFVTNENGTAYGSSQSFTTLRTPTVSTNSVSNITTVSAVCGGNVSSSGGATVTVRGICWSTSMNPTTALSTKTASSSGTGSFSNSMTGLSSMTTYYVRAYATNSVGTSYGNNISFRTN